MDISPIIHTDRRTLGKVFAEQVKEGVRKRYAGCVRGPIESNLDVSEFGWDIMKPRVSSSAHDLSAHKTLKLIQRKGLRCPGGLQLLYRIVLNIPYEWVVIIRSRREIRTWDIMVCW